MRSDSPLADQVERQAELQLLRELTQRVGSNPLLAQASTGNTSIKLDGVLWIKASGRWMADAEQNEILIPLDLADVHGSACSGISIRPSGILARRSKPPCMPYCRTAWFFTFIA